MELFSSNAGGESYDILGFGVSEDDRVDLPFEFRWPDKTETRLPKLWGEGSAGRVFEGQPGSPLPPSYTYHGTRNDQIVEYFLEARLYVESKYAPKMEVRCPLILRPAPPLHIPDPIPPVATPRNCLGSQREIWLRTHKLHPDYDPNEGLRDKIKHSFTKHRDTTPFIKFKLEVHCPSIILAREPVVMSVSLTHLERSNDLPDPPPIFLRRVRIRLVSRLDVRVPHTGFIIDTELTECHSDKRILLDREFRTGDGELLYDGLPVRTVPLPTHITPQFKTYGLALEHMIEVRLWGECAKEKFELTPVWGKVVIASGKRHDGDAPESASGAPPSLEEDAAPPPYQVLDKND